MKAVLAVLFYLTVTSSHVIGKKRLVQKPAFPTTSGRDLDRSPIYESNSHHANFPQFNDDHHQDYNGQSVHGHSNEDPSSGKYRYIVKKKTPQVFSLGPAGPSPSPYYKERRPQLYTLEQLSSPSPRPTVFSNSKTFSGVSQSPRQYYSAPSTTPDYNSPIPDKKYAFAYAVRPRDGYSGDDYSHKESRDGKVTMGEYKVLLPDGRLQVVRYTADGQTGFKADVTYEGEDSHNDHATSPRPNSKPTRSPFGEQTSAIHKQFAAPPTQSTYASAPYKPNPIFYSNPLTSHPSLSPSLVYKESRQEDHQYHDYHVDQRFDNSLNPSPPPSSAILYKVSPTPYSLKKINTTPAYTSIKKAPGPTDASFFKFKIPEPTPTPRNIYDKIHVSSSRSPYSPVPFGHRAGPSPTYPSGPAYKEQPSPSSPASYDASSTFSQSSQPQTQGRRRTRLLRLTPVEPTPIVAKVVSKSKLVPVELFKAGPAVNTNKEFRLSPSGSPAPLQFDFHGSSSQEHHDTHYFIQDEPHSQFLDHPNQNQDHHLIDDLHQQQHHDFPPVKSSLATFASGLDYNGNNVTPKPRFYVKAKPSIPLERRPAVGGLVYLETPGRGPRPNAIGVKDYFDGVPHDNLPRPKTTTHPYELGSKDYGNTVGYSPRVENYNNKKSFTPSQEIPPEYLPKLDTNAFKHHHSREYLVEGKQDTVLAYDNRSTGLTRQNQDQIVYPNYE